MTDFSDLLLSHYFHEYWHQQQVSMVTMTSAVGFHGYNDISSSFPWLQ
jgi:hypothetical protein